MTKKEVTRMCMPIAKKVTPKRKFGGFGQKRRGKKGRGKRKEREDSCERDSSSGLILDHFVSNTETSVGEQKENIQKPK